MNIYIAVVSHNHGDLINKLACLCKLNEHPDINVIVCDNVKEASLQKYCDDNCIDYIVPPRTYGFGANNNYIYQMAESLGIQSDDFFLVLNPDVAITPNDIIDACNRMVQASSSIATINLYKDSDKKISDPSIRKFPTLTAFISSFLLKSKKAHVEKSLNATPDWAAGSFLLFRASLYKALNGFDEKFFMYCEDVDICWRAKMRHNSSLLYIHDIEAVHLAQHQNRKIFSKHFYWHVKSVFRFLGKKWSIIND